MGDKINNINATGDVVSDVNSNVGTIINIQIKNSPISILSGLLLGVAGANPVTAILVGGTLYVVDEHSISNIKNAIWGEDGQSLIGQEITMYYQDGTKKTVEIFEGDKENAIRSVAGAKEALENGSVRVYSVSNGTETYTAVEKAATDPNGHLIKSIIEMYNKAETATENFLNGYAGQIKSLFTTGDGIASMISDISAGIQKGESAEQIAGTIALKAAIKELAEQGQVLLFNNATDKALYTAFASDDITSEQLQKQLSAKGQQTLNMIANSPVYQTAFIAAVSFVTTMLLNSDEGMNSQEYTVAAIESIAQAAAQVAIKEAIGTGNIGADAAVSGVTAGVCYLISASIQDMFVDDHMDSHQWQSTVVKAGIIGAAAAAAAIAVAVNTLKEEGLSLNSEYFINNYNLKGAA